MKTVKLFLLLALMTLPFAAHAQTAAYAEFTGGTLDINLPHIYGGTFGIYTQKNFGPIALGGDVRGFVNGGDSSQVYNGVVAGPRIAIKPRVIPLMPYAEILGGFSHANANNGNGNTDLAYNAVFGVDWTVIPHVDWRAIEYTYGEQHGANLAYKSLATGVVFRF